MSTSAQHVLPKWLLEAAAQPQQPPENLASVASTFLGTLYTDLQWSVVQQELEQLSRDNSIEGVLRRQEGALLGLANVHSQELPDPARIAAIQKARDEAQRSLAAELEAAEAAFRARVAEIGEQFPEAARAAEQTPENSPRAQAAARIAQTVTSADLSKLGPYWALIVLYWLIVHVTTDQVAALTLLYMVASDTFKKKD